MMQLIIISQKSDLVVDALLEIKIRQVSSRGKLRRKTMRLNGAGGLLKHGERDEPMKMDSNPTHQVIG